MKQITITNPHPGNLPGNIRDPFILRVGEAYFLTGSFPPFWNGQCPGIKLFRSDDLTHWVYVGDLIRREDIAPDRWYIDKLWAPEILHRPEGFYLTFNGRNEDPRYAHYHSVAIAFSPSIEGPYRVLTDEESALDRVCFAPGVASKPGGNDASLFEDDGHVYLFYSNAYGIWCVEITLPDCRLVGEAFLVVRARGEGCWDTKIEGPFVVKQHGIYFLFYSSFTGPYSVGYVTSRAVRGPWSPNPDAPLITPPADSQIAHSGHNAIFQGPDGRMYTVYHMQCKDDMTERFCIDPIFFHPDGTVETRAPSRGSYHITWDD